MPKKSLTLTRNVVKPKPVPAPVALTPETKPKKEKTRVDWLIKEMEIRP